MNVKTAEVERVLDMWEDHRDKGRTVNVEDLSTDPAVISEVRRRISQMEAMNWLDSENETIDLDSSSASTAEPMPPPFDTCIPWMFGNRYVLNSLIAGGGFGQVWKAWDRRLERYIAVKISKIDNTAEARHVARLQHPGIVAVHDLGEEAGFWYIVFDLVEGVDLSRRLLTDPPNWREVVRIMASVAEYVEFAHEKGFIHRDIKPANILIRSDGTPILADFGIAVTESEMAGETSTTAGTLAYMAPELLVGDGKRADVCTDVYGLGAVLFQALTGVVPYHGRNFCEVRKRILSGEPPVFPETPEKIPDELKEITLRCLAKDPDMRYQSAGELGRELRKLIAPACSDAS